MFLPKAEAQPYLHLLSSSVEPRLFDKPRIRQPFKQLKMVFDLVHQIRAYNPDVIHVQLGHLGFNLLALPLLLDTLYFPDGRTRAFAYQEKAQWDFDAYLAEGVYEDRAIQDARGVEADIPRGRHRAGTARRPGAPRRGSGCRAAGGRPA